MAEFAHLAQTLYDVLAHGDEEHRAWLRGMIQGALCVWAQEAGEVWPDPIQENS